MKGRPLCFMCLLFLILQGVILIMTSGHSLIKMPASSVFKEKETGEVLIQGQVYKKRNTSNIQILYLKNNSILSQNVSYYDSKILVYDSKFEDITIGKVLLIRGELVPFEEAHNPGNFDQRVYYAKEGIYGAIQSERILNVSGKTSEIKEGLYQIKEKWKRLLKDASGEDHGPILAAMFLGEKSEMDVEIKELYQKNGIGHILAISGLHISFIGLGIYQFIRKVGVSYTVSGIISLLILSLYAMMIGFSVSVFRAYLMLLIKIGADMTGRIYDMLTALMLSAALSVGYRPLYLTDAAFYLSYGAILGIVLILPILEKRFHGKCKFLSVCWPGISVNIALFPVQLWFYFEFPLYSILLNIVVIPLMSILLGVGMIGSGLCIIYKPLGIVCLRFCNLILMFYEQISKIVMRLPFARIVTGRPGIWALLLYYVMLSIILAGVCKKRWKQLTICFVTLFVLVCKPAGDLEITMLDVGQGDGYFIKGPTGSAYLIDGGSSDVSELGKYRIEPTLKYYGIGELDYVFISHGDTDHCSGVKEMLERQNVGIRIHNLVFAENYKEDDSLLELASIAKENNTHVKIMERGMSLKEGNLTITCLQPEQNDRMDGNEGSMVLDVVYEDFSMLFTGDTEKRGEETLIKRIQDKQYDVLKVAHHGSKNSTSNKLLKCINARVAWISAGGNNSYGHPHEETLERLRAYNYNIYQTEKEGAVHLKTNGKEIRITVFH